MRFGPPGGVGYDRRACESHGWSSPSSCPADDGAEPALSAEAVIQTPGRAAVFGFPAGGSSPQFRYWLNHGANELGELTGPNDKQLVGDFRGLGHDQVLFLNYWGGSRR